MPRMTLELDDLDYAAIQRVIAKFQASPMYPYTLPDGEGNLAGRIVAEVFRGFEEYHADWKPPQREE